MGTYFGLYSVDNSGLWIAVELNTSLDRETLYVGSLTVTAEVIPEPGSLGLLALEGLVLGRRKGVRESAEA